MMPSTSGSIWNPASVGDDPFTTCRYCGSRVMPPNIAAPVTTDSSSPMLNVELRKKRMGIRAFDFIRISTATNAAMPSAPTT